MEPAGLYWARQPRRIGKLGVRVWSGTWPPRAVLPTRTCGARSPWKGTGIPSSSAPTQPTTVGLEPTNQNPTSAARILRTPQPATNDDRRPGEPSRPEARNDLQGTKEQHTPTLDTARDPSYPSPVWGGGIRSPVTRLRIGWGVFGCRGGQPRLEEGGVSASRFSSPERGSFVVFPSVERGDILL